MEGVKKVLRMVVFIVLAAVVATVSAALNALTTYAKGITRSNR